MSDGTFKCCGIEWFEGDDCTCSKPLYIQRDIITTPEEQALFENATNFEVYLAKQLRNPKVKQEFDKGIPYCPVCKTHHDFPARCWVEQQEKGMEMTNPLLIAAYQAVIEDMTVDSDTYEPEVIEPIIQALKTRVWELETIWSKSDDQWNAEVEAFFESEIEARLPEEEEDND